MKKSTRLSWLGMTSLFLLAACNGGEEEDVSTESENGEGEETEGAEEGEQTASGGELRMAYTAQPPILDPHEGTAIATTDIMRHVYEPLVTVDSEYNIHPMLAESYEPNEDGSEITFELREGILFHNGNEMTSEDVVASMEKWGEAQGSKGQFEDATFEADGDYTVHVIFEEPLATALPLMAFNGVGFPGIMPAEIIEEIDEATGVAEEHIGTGPFQFEEWQTDQHVHLSKFDDYQPREEEPDGLAGRREALVDDLYYEFVSDDSTRVAGIQSGQYDIAQAIPFDSADQMEAQDHLRNEIHPGGFLVINFNKADGFFVEQEAREALVEAIEKESILTAGYSQDDFYIMNHNMMMDHQTDLWQSDVGEDRYNVNRPEAMTEYLDEINYDGEEITILTTRDYEDQYNSAVVVQQQLEQFGMNVELEVYDWPTFQDLIYDEDAFDITVTGYVAQPEPSSGLHFDETQSGWHEVPDLRDEFRHQHSLEDGIDMYDDLQEWYWDYLPLVKIGDFNRVTTVNESVDSFYYQDGFVFWNVAKEE